MNGTTGGDGAPIQRVQVKSDPYTPTTILIRKTNHIHTRPSLNFYNNIWVFLYISHKPRPVVTGVVKMMNLPFPR
jgi:hypothetical protein